ncbi:uncharacterized protein LOC116209641 [Punica granatum]|uniref:Uncharacterized protein LOC116209641 n=2 Tax=Punica granatum TaxID=22663 RepID=A0A6P8DTI3_PUNGR|nr:uncharacterized protein LOC116209641 [Punica granatum]XP_031399205.1 uncharacterized protein LOC116209641 [Punica granatum]XP_031399206.1 uncharacterized protein LOC116209641 [Punica granatum]XP_031399207.1 uncharacterized protein LOC116209641 [Punica granatum]XP_031399208.1 uncharacterized protein LOC116209641 [Punica granatum]XP_031399209.1 uncharacterized protein LOC116209641 [Punica granatum]XP_031399210.1 uncharacterized protein LOC116209641 [Punica granatum]PKI39101.1 hypothetical p
MASLQHQMHPHALNRRVLSENYSIDCYFCGQVIQGSAYCCQEHCWYHLHESCALLELPLQILHHPFHPQHPLELIPNTANGTDCGYSCGDCNYFMELKLAVATLPPENNEDQEEESKEEEGIIIHHVSHDHPLISFRAKMPEWITCRGCWVKESGRVYYGCGECQFLLHQSCAQAHPEIRHPFHPQHPLTLVFYYENRFRCQACGFEKKRQLAYYCHECRFHLDVPCAALFGSLLKNEDRTMIQHFSHPHQMTSFHLQMKAAYIFCPVCILQLSGEVYFCPDCFFLIHRSCADKLSPEIVHFLHPSHPLKLLEKPWYSSGRYTCSSCWRDDGSALHFNCKKCMFDLHPGCAMTTLIAAQDGVATEFQPHAHEHPMTLCVTTDKTDKRCAACEFYVDDQLTYSCSLCIEGFVLHKSCAELPREIEHAFHPAHPLTLLPQAPADYFYCSACRARFEGFTFCCITCQFYIDIGCASLKPTLKHPRHEHSLIYFDKIPILGRCDSCGKGNNIDAYCCLLCNFILHHDCLPLPPSVNHKCHPYHPLILSDKFIDGNPDSQYCDYCEKIRNPDHGVYRCEECWYTAHIGCVITETESEPDLLGEPYEDPHLTRMNEEIANLEAAIEVIRSNLKASREKLEALKRQRDRDFSKP